MAQPQFIDYEFWLAFDYYGTAKGPVPRCTKGEPRTGRGERAVKCAVRLPSSLFATPSVAMRMEVPDQGVPDITLQIEGAVDAFRQALGFDVDLQIIPHEKEPKP